MKFILIRLAFGAALLLSLLFSRAKTDRAPSATLAQAPHAATHKVVAPPEVLPDGVAGIEKQQDYGSYVLYTATEDAVAQLSPTLRAQLRIVDEMDRLLLDAASFDTQRATLSLPDAWQQAPSGPALQLVQFVGPVRAVWLDRLVERGIIPIHYVAYNGYLVWTGENGRFWLQQQAQIGQFLQYTTPYYAYFKVTPALRRRALQAGADKDLVEVTVQIRNHARAGENKARIEQLFREKDVAWQPVLGYQNATGTIPAQAIAVIAALPDVVWVGKRHVPERLDEVQGQILAGNLDAAQQGPATPGYLAWLDSYGFSDDPGDYPIVDIVDDGVGDGSINSGDPTFHRFGSAANPSRLAYVVNCTSTADGSGPDGHGHLNASIAGGYDTRTGAPYQDGDEYQRGLGINPFGRFASTRVFNGPQFELNRCNNSEVELIAQSYRQGARIISNSWGCTNCRTYDSVAQLYDTGVRDADLAEAGNQELTAVFAAGNAGPGSATVGSPGSAKNVITVGASESDRPTWIDGCFVGPAGADNLMDIASFSSRGPAVGNRAKPDVVAPGTHIQGTASTSPDFNGSGVCDQYRPTDQTVFAASSGTSHSTPAVAGVASLYYYWLQTRYGLAPSPALLKAYVAAHPRYLTGQSAGDTLPSFDQGYGMPDMGTALDDTNRRLADQSTVLDDSGETWTFAGAVADPNRPVRVVLAYTDAPGLVGSSSPQVNDLNLAVAVGGEEYLGNQFAGAWSTTGGTADSANNVEAVFLPAGASGSLTVTVTGFNVAGDGVPGVGDDTDQDFALVCYNCAESPDFSLRATPWLQSVCAPVEPVFDLTVDQILGYDDAVTLSAAGLPAGATAEFSPNPVTPPGSSRFTVHNTAGATAGGYGVGVMGTAVTSTHAITVTLDLFTQTPATPTLQSPAGGAIDQPTSVTLSWDDAMQAAGYDVEIATTSAFTQVVAAATDVATTGYTFSGLDTNTVYYWRVRAENSCGNGAFSEIFSFTTEPGPGECRLGVTAESLLAEGFEAGNDVWAHGAITGTVDTWRVVTDTVHSGGYAYHAADVANVSDQYLVSPPVSLPTFSNALTLQYWNQRDIEDSPSGCFDGAVLEVSTDGGQAWTPLDAQLLTDPYDGVVSEWWENPIGGRDAWCGAPGGWLHSVVDVTEFAGETAVFRFRLATDNSNPFPEDGWYIDDVTVQSCQAEWPYVTYLPVVQGPLVWFRQ